MAMIHVDPQGISELKNSFGTAGEEYKTNLKKLEELIQCITSGDLQGPPADELLKKYEEKKEIFNSIAQIIDEAQEYMGIKGQKFATMIDDVKSSIS